jgi:hypothetical protein
VQDVLVLGKEQSFALFASLAVTDVVFCLFSETFACFAPLRWEVYFVIRVLTESRHHLPPLASLGLARLSARSHRPRPTDVSLFIFVDEA